MFHIIYKLSVGFILPLIFAIIEVYVIKRNKIAKRDIFLKWFFIFLVGVSAVTAGLMQAFNPNYTANLLNVTMSDNIIIRELGFAQFGMGLCALLSIKLINFRSPSAIAYGIFILGATSLHIIRLSVIDIDEIVSLILDVWILVIVSLTVLKGMNRRTLNISEH